MSTPTPPSPDRPDDSLDQDHGSAFGWENADDSDLQETVRNTVNEFKALDYGFLMPLNRVFSKEFLK
jgi:hypothetical protein